MVWGAAAVKASNAMRFDGPNAAPFLLAYESDNGFDCIASDRVIIGIY